MLTEPGKSLGKVEKVAVKNMAVPTPSIDRSKKHTIMNPQVEGIEFVILCKVKNVAMPHCSWPCNSIPEILAFKLSLHGWMPPKNLYTQLVH